jgi:hypothetical protein
MEAGSMKSLAHRTALAALLTLPLCMQVHAASTSGTTPTPAKTPTAGHTYPSALPLTLQVSADRAHELQALRDFTITAQREGDYAPMVVLAPVNPFTEGNTCTRPMPEGISGCLVNDDATIGTLRIEWRVPQAGIYRFVLSGTRGSGDRVETIGAFDLEARD